MSIPKEPRQIMINIMYLVLTALLILAICSPSAHAQTGEKSGLQVDLGLGFTSGQQIEEDLGLGEIDESTGGTLRFGLTYKIVVKKNRRILV